jgi:hypothetical protein
MPGLGQEGGSSPGLAGWQRFARQRPERRIQGRRRGGLRLEASLARAAWPFANFTGSERCTEFCWTERSISGATVVIFRYTFGPSN